MATKIYTAVPKDETIVNQREVDSDFSGFLQIRPALRPKYQRTLQLGTFVTAVVLLINLAIAIYFATRHGVQEGTSVLYAGDCTRTAKLSTWSHIGINILSTILLAASNNAQQYLTGPTRAEVDRAHAAKDWLDIGVPSIRNLFSSRMGTRRRVLWWLLALGSIPLHWVYNSALFASLSAQEYSVLVVSSDFIDGTNTGFIDPVRHIWNDMDVRATNESVANIRNVMNTFEKLSSAACIEAYGQQVVSDRRDLIIVADAPSYDVQWCPSQDGPPLPCYYANPNVTNSLLQVYSSQYGQWVYADNSFDWISGCTSSGVDCSDPTTLNNLKQHWTVGDGLFYEYTPVYCLSERIDEHCTFRMSVPIMLIVCCFNVMKLVCLLLVLFSLRDAPLVTIGDAIASFMQRPDPHTRDMALTPKTEFNAKNTWVSRARSYEPRVVRYFACASTWKWFVCNFLYVAGIGTIAGLMADAMTYLAPVAGDSAATWSLIQADGFGKIVPRNILSLTSSFTASVLLANLPQLILSAIYLTYNALATSMSVTREYTSYSVLNVQKKKAGKASSLRVSDPVAGSTQRRAYYLQLPFRYTIPLMIGSTVLHWFTSQALFLARVDIYHSLNTHTPSETQILDTEASMDTCGFSVLPMVGSLIVAGIMTLVLNGIAMRKVKTGGMPVAGSCSAAIAAACHGRGNGLGPLTWGVVAANQSGMDFAANRFSEGDGNYTAEKLGFVDGIAQPPVTSHHYS